MQTFDAIISGYGPTGATLANLLGTMGMRVAVIEREKAIFDKPRAITADHEATRAFQAAGLADEVMRGTCAHPGTDFVGVQGQVIKRFYPMPAPGPLGWEPTYMFYQPALEATLREGVARFSDVKVFLGHSLVEYRQSEHSVEVDLVDGEGQVQTLSGRYLLACDGARSAVRTQMGASIHDLDFDEWWVVVDVQLLDDIELPERCVQYCRPSRPGTYIVGPDKLRRWEIKVLPGESPESFNDPAHLEAVLSTFVDTRSVQVQRVAIYRFHAVVVDQWRDGRVFLLGDAAHQMPPFMGQGLCAGVRDAYNLAWKLDAVSRGLADPAVLDTYMAERRPHVQQVVATAKSFGLIIGELDEGAARLRDERLLAELNSGVAQTVRQSFIPGLTAGLLHFDDEAVLGAGAGQLFPQPWVSGPSLPRARLDDVTRGQFYLVCREARWVKRANALFADSTCLFASAVVCLDNRQQPGFENEAIYCAEEGGFITRWLEQFEAVAVLVRPDGVAFGIARDPTSLEGLIVDADQKMGSVSFVREVTL
ncbi:bifunctional 3-(3-hydroxy-phenyl)propionate/3-hydroxycinnamic acid hydroxylase [Pseudomonas sp. PB120]|uniref:bifunctional 3-(3-hydroxy-phenyl)propionate/3-hydroxycinnamic acid hydroxylase n=1 Tax=Pseudomonas sp. PB120 TaxID=2494700 RepID=UPI0012FDF156|nr:bifunctional 3-(3-hydroxy-phenyl)propionate/3-hydroxycinnamic acid hydroxylase [Pseudomonas sp. PB120]MVV51785.1 bifunctional 3-(3-hydroxy-phenyl)propionate/3-hydroxycinnamic acid hydroxylase [Pseudomonas sp. PB120]